MLWARSLGLSCVAALACGTLAQTATSTFFRFNCAPLVYAPVDPILGNGLGSYKHTHVAFGSDAFAPLMGENLVRTMIDQTTCTTCEIDGDRSLYWVPALVAKKHNGEYAMCKTTGAHIYYLDRGVRPPGQPDIRPFPAGLRMLAGDALNRASNAGTARNQLVWKALDYVSCDVTSNGFPSTVACGVWQSRINFPNCWDGLNLIAANFSHVTYRDPSTNACPLTHPVLLPELFVEVDFDAGECSKRAGVVAGDLLLSSGDSTGFGWHVDFVSGWNEGLLGRAMNAGGCRTFSPSTCTVFTNAGAADGAARPNLAGDRFCAPRTPFPNAMLDGTRALPSEANPGTIDLSSPALLTSVSYPATIIPGAVSRATPVLIRSAVDYRYCKNNFGSIWGGVQACVCDTTTAADISQSIWEKFYLVPEIGWYVRGGSRVWLVSAVAWNSGTSTCGIQDRLLLCKWPLYQQHDLLVVDLVKPRGSAAVGAFSPGTLVSFRTAAGRRLVRLSAAQLGVSAAGAPVTRAAVFQIDSNTNQPETPF